MRRLIAVPCGDDTIVATVDLPSTPAATGLLIVSGGAELRCGAHRGMATLAGRLAAAGLPVLRYDRRGIGDSTGIDAGYAGAADDMAAAAAALRGAAGVRRVVAFGNCDAASALALFHARCGIDAVVLSNPWTGEGGDLPPPAAIRARYAARLRDPAQWRRLLTGGVDVRKLLRGLLRSRRRTDTALTDRMAAALADSGVPVTILLAAGDATAIAFAAAWRGRGTTERCDSASHSYAAPGDADWLYGRLLAACGYSAASATSS